MIIGFVQNIPAKYGIVIHTQVSSEATTKVNISFSVNEENLNVRRDLRNIKESPFLNLELYAVEVCNRVLEDSYG